MIKFFDLDILPAFGVDKAARFGGARSLSKASSVVDSNSQVKKT
jgi:hypothetical protein